jgi:hypothetical protein
LIKFQNCPNDGQPVFFMSKKNDRPLKMSKDKTLDKEKIVLILQRFCSFLTIGLLPNLFGKTRQARPASASF